MKNLFTSCYCMSTVQNRFLAYELTEESDQEESVLANELTEESDQGSVLANFHTSSSFHSFTSSHTTSRVFPRIFSSVFCPKGTC